MKDMSAEEMKEVVRAYQRAINEHDWDALDSVLAEDVATPLMMPGFPPGREGAKALAQATLGPWPDFQTRIDALIAEGDRVVAQVTMTGTAVNPGLGLPGTGKPFTMTGAYMVRIADGRIVEHAGVEDALGMLAQIGAMG